MTDRKRKGRGPGGKPPEAGSKPSAAGTGGAAPPAIERVPGKRLKTEAADSAARKLAVRVRKTPQMSHSSQLWLQRQLNDPYVARARREGLRSRAAFKLTEIDDKYRLLKPGHRIVDLGSAPGGWAQVAADRIGVQKGRGLVVGIDLLPVETLAGVTFLEMDFMDDTAPDRLRAILGGPADGVLSDMAGNTTGHRATDHLRIIGLAEAAALFAREVLVPGGFFLTKLFQGGETASLITTLKRDYATVRHVKPGASRADSSEVYVLASGYRGARAVPGS